MSLRTHSKFYFGFEVSAENDWIDFDEGSGELSAQVAVGSYTLEQLAVAIADALNSEGTLEYTVTVDRATRKLTISAGANFELLVTAGTHSGTSVFGTAGFTTDRSGDDSYLADNAIGSVYTTQFILQNHVDQEDSQAATYGTVNKSASGKVEVVTFGLEKFIEFNLRYVNNYEQAADGPIRENLTGVENLRTFMRYLTTKAPLEFMPDEDDPDTFVSMFLESTPEDSMGLKYKLKEQYERNLPGYFDTGVLKFRVIE